VRIAPAVASTAPATAAELRSRAVEVLADRRYQRDLPIAEPRKPSPSETPPQLSGEPGGGGLPADVGPEPAPIPVSEVSTLVHVVLWVLLSAAAVLGVLWVVQTLPQRRRSTADVAAPERTARETSGREIPGDPAGLAAQGRYTEAVHALLLTAIALLSRRFRLPLPPSRTSRELLRALPIQGAAREAFAGLVRTVERSWFGGAAIGPEEYAASVERFRAVEGREG
jgi:hypothetical protein